VKSVLKLRSRFESYACLLVFVTMSVALLGSIVALLDSESDAPWLQLPPWNTALVARCERAPPATALRQQCLREAAAAMKSIEQRKLRIAVAR
jgi:hypothetical protein